jgi:CysZ protein
MILGDFTRALGQLSDPRFRRVLWLGIALTVALLIAVYALFLWALSSFDPGSLVLPVVGEVTWIGDLLGWASLFLMIFLSMFLMIPVASAITSLFLDDVAQAVEDRHYPHLPVPPRVPFSEALADTVNFLGVLIGANILALFLYAFFPPAAPFIFFALNGFLLGREYFMIAAMRREGRAGAKAMRARHRGTIWLAGCMMALPLTIPVLNLFVPVLGAATFTHLYHRLSAQRG